MFRNYSSLQEIRYLNVDKIKIFGLNFNLNQMFYNCCSLKDIDVLSLFDIKDIKVTSFVQMFGGCCSLINLLGIKEWNISGVYCFSNIFDGCSSLQNLQELKDWNVSNGREFSCMFKGCSSLHNLEELKNWNAQKGNFSHMFEDCSSL